MSKKINYKETFIFPDIPDVLFPVYSISESGKICNFKSIIYPSTKSIKKYTRNRQLRRRSLQAKIFDAFINIGYFNPLTVYREFPVVIQNSLRLPEQTGMYYMADYYFPELRLFVELDSETHDPKKDSIRDKYLNNIGINVYRINNLEKPEVQKKIFPKFIEYVKTLDKQTPIQFDFLLEIKKTKNL